MRSGIAGPHPPRNRVDPQGNARRTPNGHQNIALPIGSSKRSYPYAVAFPRGRPPGSYPLARKVLRHHRGRPGAAATARPAWPGRLGRPGSSTTGRPGRRPDPRTPPAGRWPAGGAGSRPGRGHPYRPSAPARRVRFVRRDRHRPVGRVRFAGSARQRVRRVRFAGSARRPGWWVRVRVAGPGRPPVGRQGGPT
jgi:hypothetical protein